MRERWRKVRRATGYKVSSLGRVRSIGGTLPGGAVTGGVMLSQTRTRDGYLRVTINGERVLVHHLVLEAFDRLRPYGLEGCHGPGGKGDNSVGNLRWDTHQANERDKRQGQTLTVRSGSVELTGDKQAEAGNRTWVSPHPRSVTPVAGDVRR